MLHRNGWRFHHAGLIVRDTKAACAFYEALGFEVVAQPYVTPPKFPDNPMNSVVSFVRKGGFMFEIMQPVEGRWVAMDFIETIGEGVNHLCFEVDDIEAERRHMTEAGYPIVYGFDVPIGTFSYFDTRRMGNVMIELLQLNPGVSLVGGGAP